jgi:transcriptional regulator with XRE-family HTH domain
MPSAPAKAEWRSPAVRSRVTSVDRHVGARMRERRAMLGLSQHDLADLLGVTFQQAHRYEKGTHRITAGRLHQVAGALGVEVGYFYEGVEKAGDASGPTPRQRRLLELARHFLALPDPERKALCELARALAEPAAERPS